LEKLTLKEHSYHQNNFLGPLSENPRFSGFAVHAFKEAKKYIKNTRWCNFTHMLTPPTFSTWHRRFCLV